MITQANLLSSLIDETSSLRNRLSTTQDQIASGLVSTTYSGLGDQALKAVSLAPQITTQKTYQHNISAAQGSLQITQSALTIISGIASNFYAQVNTVSGKDPQAIQNLASAATSALQQVANQLNSKNGDAYVFAGTDTSTPPVTTDDPTILASDLLASSTATPPFSSTLGTTTTRVQIGDGLWQSIGLLANKNTYVPSAPPSTGSYMRDIMTSLASLSQLTTDPNPQATANTVRSQLSGAISAISTEAGVLGGVQNTLTQQQTNISSLTTTLKSQLSDAQDVDVAAAITRSSQLQTQLQASYQIIAQTRTLSLANYL